MNAIPHIGTRPAPCDETCQKCGGNAITVRYMGKQLVQGLRENVVRSVLGKEMLELSCSCGYSWERLPLDADPKAEVRP